MWSLSSLQFTTAALFLHPRSERRRLAAARRNLESETEDEAESHSNTHSHLWMNVCLWRASKKTYATESVNPQWHNHSQTHPHRYTPTHTWPATAACVMAYSHDTNIQWTFNLCVASDECVSLGKSSEAADILSVCSLAFVPQRRCKKPPGGRLLENI